MNLSSLGNVGSTYPVNNQSAKTHLPSRPLKEIFENGTEDELVVALGKLPNGRCDLRCIELTEPMVKMLAGAVQRVKVDTLLLGHMKCPDHLLEVILHSQVREWDFLHAWNDWRWDMTSVFPSGDQAEYLASEVLPKLHRDSCTQRIVLHECSLTADEHILLVPFCIDGHGPNDSSRCGAFRSVVLTQASGTYAPATTASATTVAQTAFTQEPQPVASVSRGTDRRPMSDSEHARVLCQLVTVIPTGDVKATAELAKALGGCSREQFDLLQSNARVLANLGDNASRAAQEILKLRYPVAAQPHEQQASVPNLSDYGNALRAGNVEAVRSLLTASNGVVDMGPNGRVARGAGTDTLLHMLENVPIDLLKLTYVDEPRKILGALAGSQTKCVDLTLFNDHWKTLLQTPKWLDEEIEHLIAFLNSVSLEQPIKELYLDSSMLETNQSDRLKSGFAWTETVRGTGKQITFTKQLASPPRVAQPPSNRTPDQPSRPLATQGSHAPSKPTAPVDDDVFLKVVGSLMKWIPMGNVGGVRGAFLTPDAQRLTFNDVQKNKLRALVARVEGQGNEKATTAARAVLDFL